MADSLPLHSNAYRFRRFLNWFPLGLAYAFLYMGRYNLTVFARVVPDDVMSKADFGDIFAAGAIVYGFGFLVTGPLVDRIGGRRGMLTGTAGAIVMNAAMGTVILGTQQWGWQLPLLSTFTVLFCFNMFFQSFGAISIVTVKAPWFHVRERGTFSTTNTSAPERSVIETMASITLARLSPIHPPPLVENGWHAGDAKITLMRCARASMRLPSTLKRW